MHGYKLLLLSHAGVGSGDSQLLMALIKKLGLARQGQQGTIEINERLLTFLNGIETFAECQITNDIESEIIVPCRTLAAIRILNQFSTYHSCMGIPSF